MTRVADDLALWRERFELVDGELRWKPDPSRGKAWSTQWAGKPILGARVRLDGRHYYTEQIRAALASGEILMRRRGGSLMDAGLSRKIGASPLRAAIAESGAERVLGARSDPFFMDSESGHRDGAWVAAQFDRLLSSTAIIHWRGFHYVLVAAGDVIRPDGARYLNDAESFDWLTEIASKRAVWLRYIDPDRITDNRNAEPVIFRSYGEGATAAAVYASLGVTLPELDVGEVGDCLPFPSPPTIDARQRYLIAIFGEKSSLDFVLRPLAERYGANMYLASGELSDTLIRHMAKDAAQDPHGRPLVVLCFSDFDPAGTQMPVSIAWKLQALKAIEFPDLEFQVTPVSLTLDQVLAERLPTTPVKAGDARRDRWQAAYGPVLHEAGLIEDPSMAAQVEIDALAALRPERLRAMAREAIEGAYFDATLARRANVTRDAWREEAQAAIDRQIDPADFEAVREDAAEALTRLTDALNDLRACDDRLDELCAAISLPGAPEAPEPEVDEDAQRPLADSEWGMAEVSRALRARKSYSDGDEE